MTTKLVYLMFSGILRLFVVVLQRPSTGLYWSPRQRHHVQGVVAFLVRNGSECLRGLRKAAGKEVDIPNMRIERSKAERGTPRRKLYKGRRERSLLYGIHVQAHENVFSMSMTNAAGLRLRSGNAKFCFNNAEAGWTRISIHIRGI